MRARRMKSPNRHAGQRTSTWKSANVPRGLSTAEEGAGPQTDPQGHTAVSPSRFGECESPTSGCDVTERAAEGPRAQWAVPGGSRDAPPPLVRKRPSKLTFDLIFRPRKVHRRPPTPAVRHFALCWPTSDTLHVSA